MNSNMNRKREKIFEYAWFKIKRLFGTKATLKLAGKRHTIYPVKLLVFLVAVIVAVSAVASTLLHRIGVSHLEIGFESGNEYKTKVIGSDVLMYNNRGAKAINQRGETEWEIERAMSEPIAEVSGDYVLMYDLSGNHFASSYKNGKLKHEFVMENDIISAKITDRGFCVFATDTDGYKGRAVVYNKRGKEIYQWNSGSGYITDVDITENGRYLAVAQLISEGDSADTKIQFIDTRRGEVVATAERSDEVVVNLKFISGSKLIAVTDKHILGLGTNGRNKFEISLIGRGPSLYNIDSDNTIAVVTQGSSGNSVLELYSVSGRLRGEYTATGDIRALSVSGRGAVVAQQKGVTRVSGSGKEKSIVNVSHDVKSLGYFGKGKRALVIGSAQAEVVSVK